MRRYRGVNMKWTTEKPTDNSYRWIKFTLPNSDIVIKKPAYIYAGTREFGFIGGFELIIEPLTKYPDIQFSDQPIPEPEE